MKNITISLSMLLAIALFGCGGGGSGGYGSSGGGRGIGGGDGDKVGALSPDCNGSYCSINPATGQYTGSGIGVWRYTNTVTDTTASVPISLSNVAGKNILLVFSNEKSNIVNLPSIYVNSSLLQKIDNIEKRDTRLFNNIPKVIREFDKVKALQELGTKTHDGRLAKIAPKVWQVGNQSSWYVAPDEVIETRTATLQKQLTSNGRQINFWVENSEYTSGKITDSLLTSLSSSFANTIYGNVTQIAGEPWGTHSYSSSLIDSNQPLDIVLVNFDKNSKAGGLLGYFWSLNNFKSYNGSNEALAMFIDTETLYISPSGLDVILSTMAHELTHMINFYQRDVGLSSNDAYDVFLEEMTAVMMEDIIGDKIGRNDVKSSNYPYWLYDKLYNIDFTTWASDGGHYNVAGSFGAFLLRQHGINFYKQLLQTPTNGHSRAKSIELLDKVIKDYNSEGLERAVQRWGASIALFPIPGSPANFGYPEKTAASNDGFYLEEFDGNDFVSMRNLPSASPSTLRGYSHFPVRRQPAGNIYEETVQVPYGVSLSVVVK